MTKEKFSYSSLSYGYELEGAFFNTPLRKKTKFIIPIEERYPEIVQKIDRFTDDASVSSRIIEIARTDGKVPQTEFRSDIFLGKRGFEALIKELLFWHSDNYTADDSCGFHLHIGFLDELDGRDKLLFFGDYKWLQKVAEEASKWSLEQAQRIHDNGYCKLESNLRQVIKYEQSKYTFMRFHPQGTLEFRFLETTTTAMERTRRTEWLINEVINHLNSPLKLPKTEISIPKFKKEKVLINI
jgi:hypothetical protein